MHYFAAVAAALAAEDLPAGRGPLQEDTLVGAARFLPKMTRRAEAALIADHQPIAGTVSNAVTEALAAPTAARSLRTRTPEITAD